MSTLKIFSESFYLRKSSEGVYLGHFDLEGWKGDEIAQEDRGGEISF